MKRKSVQESLHEHTLGLCPAHPVHVEIAP